MAGGKPFIKSGSKAATIGTILVSITNSFLCVTESDITAPIVASEPVPAVVGMAKNGAEGFLPLRIPTSCLGSTSLLAASAITFAASIDEPPPIANTESQFWAR